MADAEQLYIDQELLEWLPRCTPEREKALEAELTAAGGARDTIKVWRNPDDQKLYIVDGHRRYRICTEHDLYYEVEELAFEDKAGAMEWMFREQDARRNWTHHERSLVLAAMTKLMRKQKREAGQWTGAVAEEVAAVADVDPRTVYRAEKYAAALESLPAKLREVIESGKVQASQRDVIELGAMQADDWKVAAKELLTCEFDSLGAWLRGEGNEDGHEKYLGGGGKDGAAERKEKKNRGKKKGPPMKPTETYFHEVEWRLGSLKKTVDELGNAKPGPMYQRCMDILDQAGDVIRDWKNED